MDETCNQSCSECERDCGERQEADLREAPHPLSHIKKVIGVVSGKGGVGKSLVTALLAVKLQRSGYACAVMDADITGPSIPRAFGLREKAEGNELGLFPVKSKTGIPVMSVNLLLPGETDPVVWRGPIIAGMIKQFWTDVVWGDLDFLFVDLPPGTGDVPLTVFQSLPIDGIIMVTTPQELVSMVVGKAVNMAQMMRVPILGLIENMSYVRCPGCGESFSVFGESRLEETARQYGIPAMDRLPIDPNLAALCDKGLIELFEGDFLSGVAARLDSMMENTKGEAL